MVRSWEACSVDNGFLGCHMNFDLETMGRFGPTSSNHTTNFEDLLNEALSIVGHSDPEEFHAVRPFEYLNELHAKLHKSWIMRHRPCTTNHQTPNCRGPPIDRHEVSALSARCSPSECCSQTMSDRPPTAFLQRSTAAGLVECPPYPES